MQKMINTPQDKAKGRDLHNILTAFREVDGEMPVQQMMCLVWIANNEGKTQKDLRTSLNMFPSTSSRNLAALSKVHRLGKAGHGLIDFVDDVEDRRQKQLWLTPKGRQFIGKVLGFL